MDALRQDLRFAFRTLVRRPLVALVAAGSLALGIGATTALMSVVHVFLLRPVPGVEGFERAVELGRARDGRGGFDTFSYPDFLDLRTEVDALEEVAGYRTGDFSFRTERGGERVQGMLVSANYFDALGVRPERGRVFLDEEDVGLGEHPVVVVSWDFWQNELGGEPGVVGRTIRLNRTPLTIVGVAPEAFHGHVLGIRNDVFVPLTMGVALNQIDAPVLESRRASWLQAVGRLAQGATVERAEAVVKALFERLQEAHPESNRGRTARAIALGPVPGAGRPAAAGFLTALLGLGVLVLLVTCANVAGMFLARAVEREREIAVRLAVGSGRPRLVRQLLTESLVVFTLGGLGGMLLASWSLDLVDLGALPIPVEISVDLVPDTTVLVLSLGVTLATGVVFGLIPALWATRTGVLPALRGAGKDGAGRSRLARGLVATQVGLSLALLVAAGLLLRSLQRAVRLPTGFDARDVYTTTLNLELEGYDDETGPLLQARLLERVGTLFGSEAAALALDLPMDLASHGTVAFPEGWVGPDGRESLGVDYNVVSPGFFEALRIDIVRGRGFGPDDRAGAEEVAVVSRAFAERVWPGEDPLGRRFRFGRSDNPWIEVAGVADDVKNQTIMEETTPFVYRPYAQWYDARTHVVVRSGRGSGAVATMLREAVLDVDPSLSMTPPVSVERVTAVGVLPQRVAASVASGLAALALLLSGLGIYGVVAHAVTRRTRELGVRMALGAARRRVLAHVVRRGVLVSAPGLVLGGLLALALGHLLAAGGFLLGLSAVDPVTLVSVAVVLLAVVLVASLIPARRAASIDPMEALRVE